MTGSGVLAPDAANGGLFRAERRFGARTLWWSSYVGRMMDALAPTGDEGRGKLR